MKILMMKQINTNHPYWKFHLDSLIDEKVESRDKKCIHKKWMISDKMLSQYEESEIPMLIKGLILPYLEENIDKIKNFQIFEHYSPDDFSLIIDLKVEPLKTLSHSGINN